MKKVSVFTVLTCFLVGTAHFPCYAGNSWPWEKSGESTDDNQPKGVQTQPSKPSVGRGRGSGPIQPSTSIGRGAGRGALSQPLEPAGQGMRRRDAESVRPKPSPSPSLDPDVHDFPGNFDDDSSASNATQMTDAEKALYAQWVSQGKVPGIVYKSDSSHLAVPSVHGPVRGEEVEPLSPSTVPSPNPAPSPTTSTLAPGRDAEQSTRPSPSPVSSSTAIDDEKIKGHETLFLYAPQNAVVVEKGNYRLAKVALLCVVTEWKNLAEAAKHPSMRKLIDEQTPEKDISRLNRGVKWAKYYLAKKGKEHKKPEAANGFTQLIEARMNGLIEQIRQSIELNEEPSVSIRFQQDTINEKFMFSVEENLGKVILVEIPGQEI